MLRVVALVICKLITAWQVYNIIWVWTLYPDLFTHRKGMLWFWFKANIHGLFHVYLLEPGCKWIYTEKSVYIYFEPESQSIIFVNARIINLTFWKDGSGSGSQQNILCSGSASLLVIRYLYNFIDFFFKGKILLQLITTLIFVYEVSNYRFEKMSQNLNWDSKVETLHHSNQISSQIDQYFQKTSLQIIQDLYISFIVFVIWVNAVVKNRFRKQI
jgi:hypothetical protein